MIQVNQLRIGNIITTPFGEYSEISGIGIKEGSGYVEIKDKHIGYYIDVCEPIPLTEETLLKCGFVCFAESEVSKGFSIGTNPVTSDYMVTLTWLKDIFQNKVDNYPFFKNGHHVIKHLHELQNLYFALTRQELEVKL